MRLLVVDDEKSLQTVIGKELTREGYSVDLCGDGNEALDYIAAGEYDCIVLDVMLPGKNGIAVLKELRDAGNFTPVLLLTAMDAVGDRVKGLDSGADDYLVKPFSFDELFARIRVLVRRGSDNKEILLSAGDLVMNTVSRSVTRNDCEIDLTSKEYSLLEYLLRNKNSVISRDQILEHVWNFDFEGDSNIVDVYIRYLRRKMDNGYDTKLIQTIRGSGYVIREK